MCVQTTLDPDHINDHTACVFEHLSTGAKDFDPFTGPSQDPDVLALANVNFKITTAKVLQCKHPIASPQEGLLGNDGIFVDGVVDFV